jgi:transglutaminase-like putative cysteine protease
LLQAYVDSISREPLRSVDFLVALNARVQQSVGYTIRMEPGVQTPEETLTLGYRLLPRFCLVAGTDTASPGLGRTLSFPAT